MITDLRADIHAIVADEVRRRLTPARATILKRYGLATPSG